MIDFSKAFDVVRHDVLGAKLVQLKHALSFSSFKPINIGIV